MPGTKVSFWGLSSFMYVRPHDVAATVKPSSGDLPYRLHFWLLKLLPLTFYDRLCFLPAQTFTCTFVWERGVLPVLTFTCTFR